MNEEFSEGGTAWQKKYHTSDLGSNSSPAINEICDSGQTTSPLWSQTSPSTNMRQSIRLYKVPPRSITVITRVNVTYSYDEKDGSETVNLPQRKDKAIS